MSEERLNEIKDSVNFQRKLLLAHNMNTLCVDEEQELIEEIDRLNNIINELEKDSIAYKKLNAWIVNRHAPDLFHKMEIIDKLTKLNKGSE